MSLTPLCPLTAWAAAVLACRVRLPDPGSGSGRGGRGGRIDLVSKGAHQRHQYPFYRYYHLMHHTTTRKACFKVSKLNSRGRIRSSRRRCCRCCWRRELAVGGHLEVKLAMELRLHLVLLLLRAILRVHLQPVVPDMARGRIHFVSQVGKGGTPWSRAKRW